MYSLDFDTAVHISRVAYAIWYILVCLSDNL